nr:MAG TPA: hypothetical protein [Caudoviricetes sp.]
MKAYNHIKISNNGIFNIHILNFSSYSTIDSCNICNHKKIAPMN